MPSPDAATEGHGLALRPIDWSELVAKLAAARDLRGILAGVHGNSKASFSSGAAGALVPGRTGKLPVNPDALGHGKAAPGIDIAADDIPGCDREMR